MKVSNITATFNSEKSIQRTIDSVAGQDYKDIEHIIIDGDSTDSTLSIIQSNSQHIYTFISEKDKGIYDALNKLIKLASGDIIGVLNSDDIFTNMQVISKVANCFQVKGCDVLYGNLKYQSKDETNRKTIRYRKSNKSHPDCLKYGWMPPHFTVYCKNEVYKRYGQYDEKFKISANYDYILRIFKKPVIKKTYIPVVMVKKDVGGISIGSPKGIFEKSREDYMAIRQNNAGGSYAITIKNLRNIIQFNKFRNAYLKC